MPKITEGLTKYFDYLDDLRHRLYVGVIIFVITFVIGFLAAGPILSRVMGFIRLEKVTIATSAPFQFADIAMDIGFFIAIMVSVPYFIYSFYSFIAPALTKDERWRLFKSVPISIGLFGVGFAYGFFILYYALELLANINYELGIKNIWNLGEFLSQMFLTAALLGVVFEFPLLLTLAIKMGIIDAKFLKDKRRFVYFLIFCIISLLPPTDGLSLIAMSLPLVLLYEVTILLNNK